MERLPFKEIVLAWRDQEFGGRVPLDRSARIEGFLSLFDTLLANGYEAFEIFTPSNKGMIVSLSHNSNHRDAAKRKIWQELVEEDLMVAKGRHKAWPRVEIKKHDTQTDNYQPGLARASEPTSQVTSDTSSDRDVSIDESNEETAPLLPPVKQRAFTEEEWNKVPKIKVEYDPELRKLLGYDDE